MKQPPCSLCQPPLACRDHFVAHGASQSLGTARRALA